MDLFALGNLSTPLDAAVASDAPTAASFKPSKFTRRSADRMRSALQSTRHHVVTEKENTDQEFVTHLRLCDSAEAARAPLPKTPVAAASASVSGVSSVVSSKISASS